MNLEDDKYCLENILDCIKHINTYIDGIIWDRFSADEMKKDAVTMRLWVMGKFYGHLSDGIKNKIEKNNVQRFETIVSFWTQRLEKINWESRWNFIKQDMPLLNPQLKNLLFTFR